MARINASEIKAQEAAKAAELAKTEGDNTETQRRLGKALFPDGFSDSEIGSLDRNAALNGEASYVDGSAFDRAALVAAVAAKLATVADVDLLEIKRAVDALPEKPAAVSPALPDENGIVDTSVLTGDRGGLKNFLIKKSRDKESKS